MNDAIHILHQIKGGAGGFNLPGMPPFPGGGFALDNQAANATPAATPAATTKVDPTTTTIAGGGLVTMILQWYINVVRDLLSLNVTGVIQDDLVLVEQFWGLIL